MTYLLSITHCTYHLLLQYTITTITTTRYKLCVCVSLRQGDNASIDTRKRAFVTAAAAAAAYWRSLILPYSSRPEVATPRLHCEANDE